MNDFKTKLTALGTLKRLIDLIGSTLSLLLLAPVLWLIIFLVWLDSRGPILLAESRRGYRGRLFLMLRFRTSLVVGEQDSGCEKPDNSSAGGHLVQPSSGRQLTGLGRVLRRLRLDELPELFNVVRGEMSLVGPRPLSIADGERLSEQDRHEYERRLNVMPGIIGGWQADCNQCG